MPTMQMTTREVRKVIDREWGPFPHATDEQVCEWWREALAKYPNDRRYQALYIDCKHAELQYAHGPH